MSRFNPCNCPAGNKERGEHHAPDCPSFTGMTAAMAAMLSVSGHKGSKAVTDKLKAVAKVYEHAQGFLYVSFISCGDDLCSKDDHLIRLTDHEAAMSTLQEDRDQQYDMKVKAREQRDAVTNSRAADKARIAELVRALRKVAGEVDGNIRECVRDCVNQRGNVQDIYDYCDNIDTAIDAVLAQQGKEGGV